MKFNVNKMKKFFQKLISFIFYSLPLLVFAEESIVLPNPLETSSITAIIERVTNALAFQIAPPLVAAMIIIGAIQMLFAKGDPRKFEEGKKIVMYSVIGYVIIIIATGIVNIIEEILSKRS